MIQKISKGSGFRGAVSYLLRERSGEDSERREGERGKKSGREAKGDSRESTPRRAGSGDKEAEKRPQRGKGRGKSRGDREDARIIGGNMAGQNSRQLASEFKLSRSLRPGVDKAVFHASLSLPRGERLSDEQWRTVASDYVKRMGFDNSQHVVVRHQDKEHDHVHIVASRITMDGKVVSESNDYQRGEAVVRQLEKEHGLREVRPSREALRKTPNRVEIERMVKTGEPSARMRTQQLVDQAIHKEATMPQMVERLEAAGVEVNLRRSGGGDGRAGGREGGRFSGVSYKLDGVPMKGSDLGRGYTWEGLQKRGVSYERERDDVALNRREQPRGERGHSRAAADGREAGGARGGERTASRGERAAGEYARQSHETEQAARRALREAERVRHHGGDRGRQINADDDERRRRGWGR